MINKKIKEKQILIKELTDKYNLIQKALNDTLYEILKADGALTQLKELKEEEEKNNGNST